MWIQLSADICVDRTGRGIDAGHAAKADRRDRHRHHRQKQRRYRMSVREYLAFTEERDRGDRRCQDDSVIDQVPQAQRALEMGLRGTSCLSGIARSRHPHLFWIESFNAKQELVCDGWFKRKSALSCALVRSRVSQL